MKTCETVQRGNVQPHSAGDIMPYTVVAVTNGLTSHGYCQLMNMETGAVYQKWHFTRFGSGHGGFRSAHHMCEAQARDFLRGESESLDQEPWDGGPG